MWLEQWKEPVRIASKHTDYSASSSWAFTLPSTPTEGNFMIILVGGIQSRTLAISGSGWTQTPLDPSDGAKSHAAFFKTAGAGETTSITITITGGTLQGVIEYFELADADLLIPLNLRRIVSPSVLLSGSMSSAASAAYTVVRPCFAISSCVWDDTRQFAPNNSFTSLSGIGRMQSAYRQYNINPVNQTVTWSLSAGSNALTCKMSMIFILGKRIS